LTVLVCEDHVTSLVTWTQMSLTLNPLHYSPVDGGVLGPPFPVVHDPGTIVVGDQAYHCLLPFWLLQMWPIFPGNYRTVVDSSQRT
jgi:hypothetical protein